MAIVTEELGHLQAGQNGWNEYFGVASFVTTGATVDVVVPTGGGSIIYVAPILPLTTPGAATGDYPITAAVSGSTVTYTRAAGSTSALSFYFLIRFR